MSIRVRCLPVRLNVTIKVSQLLGVVVMSTLSWFSVYLPEIYIKYEST